MLDYNTDAASPAASLLETKLLINSTISQAANGCCFMTLDIKGFFLQTEMNDHEYMCIHSKYIFGNIREKYDLKDKKRSDRYVYCKIKKGMYRLKQAARLAYYDLKLHLKIFGYSPDPIATNIWKHSTRRTKFGLYVDDFGVQYFSPKDADHLISALSTKYDITIDRKGKKFCGLQLDWDYVNSWVDISMPQYVRKTLDQTSICPS